MCEHFPVVIFVHLVEQYIIQHYSNYLSLSLFQVFTLYLILGGGCLISMALLMSERFYHICSPSKTPITTDTVSHVLWD